MTYNRSHANGSTKLLSFFHNLHRQFTRRRQNQKNGLGKPLPTFLLLHVQMKGRQEKTTRFSRSSLGNGNQILALQGQWPTLRLNRRWFGKASPREGRLEFVIKRRVAKMQKGRRKVFGVPFGAVSSKGNSLLFAPLLGTEIAVDLIGFGLVHGSRATTRFGRVGVRIGPQALGLAAVFRIFQFIVFLTTVVLVALAAAVGHDCLFTCLLVCCFANTTNALVGKNCEMRKKQRDEEKGKDEWRCGLAKVSGSTTGSGQTIQSYRLHILYSTCMYM